MPDSVRVLKLMSGGSLTFSADIDLFALTPEDREFLTDLVNRLSEYEERVSAPQDSIAPSDDGLAKASTIDSET